MANIVRRKNKQTNKQKWITANILDLCDKRRKLGKKLFELERSERYKEVNNSIKRCMKKAKENWIEEQCSEIEENLRKNNSKRVYLLVKDLTTVKKRESDYCPRSFRKTPHRRATDTEPMDRILL